MSTFLGKKKRLLDVQDQFLNDRASFVLKPWSNGSTRGWEEPQVEVDRLEKSVKWPRNLNFNRK